jgi:aarF domain-containing kinase
MQTMSPFARYYLESLRKASKFGLLTNENLRKPQSNLEENLRAYLFDAIEGGRALGAQVTVIQNGKLLADIAGGVMGLFDPRPVSEGILYCYNSFKNCD